MSLLEVSWDLMSPEYVLAVNNAIVLKYGNANGCRFGFSRSIANIVYGLFKCGCEWDSLSDDAKQSIQFAIVYFSDTFNSQDVCNTVFGLGRMGAVWNTLNEDCQQAICKIIVTNFHTIKDNQSIKLQTVSNLVYGLGKLSCKWSCLGESVCLSLSNSIVQFSNDYCSQMLSNLVYGMGLMEAPWHSMTSNYTVAISKAIVSVLGTANACRSGTSQGVANLVYGFGKSGVVWSELGDDLKKSIQFGFIYYSKSHTVQGLANIIYGLGLMGAVWHETTPEFRKAVSEAAVRQYGSEESYKLAYSQALSNLVYGLGKCGCLWNELSHDTRGALTRGVIYSSSSCTSVQITIIVYGMGLMEAPWRKMSSEYKQSVTTAIVTNFSTIDGCKIKAGQELVNVLYGLGKSGCSWSGLSETLRFTLRNAAADLSEYLPNSSLAILVYSMGQIGAMWWDMNKAYLSSVSTAIIKHYGTELSCSLADSQAISNIIYGLGKSECVWDNFHNEFREALSFSFKYYSDKFNSQGISNALLGMASMEFVNIYLLLDGIMTSLKLNRNNFTDHVRTCMNVLTYLY